ncbi:MAG TPA: hypothetical protein VFN20_14620 [Candidatus Acidoferrum sp.]|nr:hypothetical protein [Candidatus Acidoferrum sp.]
MSDHYRHSGKSAPEGPVLGLLLGSLVAIPAAFLYDYAIFSIDHEKLRILCPIAFGALIGAACGVAMCWGKVRNKHLAGAVGACSAFFGLALSWAAWILHLVYPSRWIFNLVWPMTHPAKLWAAIVAVNATGTWGYDQNHAVKGSMLWFIWTAEALLVLGFSVLTAVALVQRRPFCERCGDWCREHVSLYFAPSTAPAQFQALLESDGINSVEKLAAGSKKLAHYRLHLQTCAICHSLNTVSLVQNFPRDRKTLVDKLLVSPEQAGVFRNLEISRMASSAAVASPAS